MAQKRMLIMMLAVMFIFSCSGGDVLLYMGHTYKTVKIGEQIWMAENLNYAASDSKCYADNLDECEKYGRLYSWAIAMGFPSSCNSNSCKDKIQSPHRGICPEGWHIPSNADWDKLLYYVDGSSGTESPYESLAAGKALKAKTGWQDCGVSGVSSNFCNDSYDFSALPGGNGYHDGGFSNANLSGYWWSANENYGNSAYSRGLGFNYELAYWSSDDKNFLFSVRCLKD
ncbi:MAG: fibrobacter succinogenes major paralogous domain-containing protein [Fibromonadales bacterium]|nr:fibrobacter succinogenes major paralogous domain-containing protein [Fibromonadales bacterium]